MAHLLASADARRLPLPDESAHCAVTSPPYWSQRRYTDRPGEIGRGTLDDYVAGLVAALREVRRVLRRDGTLVLNLGDKYRSKQLLGVPWRVALALQADGWKLRSDSIWWKPNGMPDAAPDRPEAMHEYVFVLAKSARPFWDKYAVPRPDRLSVRKVPVGRTKCAHFASYPPALVLPYILQATSQVGCCSACGAPWRRLVRKTRVPTRPGRSNAIDPTGMAKRDRRRHVTLVATTGWAPSCECRRDNMGEEHPVEPAVVLDPFAGTCATAVACDWSGRASIMCDLGRDYLGMGRDRLAAEGPRRPVAAPPARADLPGQGVLPGFSPDDLTTS